MVSSSIRGGEQRTTEAKRNCSRMPKGTNSHAFVSRRSRTAPYHLKSSQDELLEVNSSDEENALFKKDWEDLRCPICMHSPHNAVLLLCSSHEKGCHPYMCDTSYRHSNCLDQFRKAYSASTISTSSNESDHSVEISAHSSTEPVAPSRLVVDRLESHDVVLEVGTSQHSTSVISDRQNEISTEGSGPDTELLLHGSCELPGLVCPLCRGKVKGWTVVHSVRKYLNAKSRSCAQESCSFVGTYTELRKHARCVHPHARPSELDPDQQRKWRRLEQQQDIGDVLSNIRSEIPGAMVFGDYVIEGDSIENEDDGVDFPGEENNWLTVFLLFQVFEPTATLRSGRNTSSRWRGLARGIRRLGANSSRRQGLWGESFEADTESNMSGSSDAGENTGSSASRRRRSQRRP